LNYCEVCICDGPMAGEMRRVKCKCNSQVWQTVRMLYHNKIRILFVQNCTNIVPDLISVIVWNHIYSYLFYFINCGLDVERTRKMGVSLYLWSDFAHWYYKAYRSKKIYFYIYIFPHSCNMLLITRYVTVQKIFL